MIKSKATQSSEVGTSSGTHYNKDGQEVEVEATVDIDDAHDYKRPDSVEYGYNAYDFDDSDSESTF